MTQCLAHTKQSLHHWSIAPMLTPKLKQADNQNNNKSTDLKELWKIFTKKNHTNRHPPLLRGRFWLCHSGWPGTQYVDQARLEFIYHHAQSRFIFFSQLKKKYRKISNLQKGTPPNNTDNYDITLRLKRCYHCDKVRMFLSSKERHSTGEIQVAPGTTSLSLPRAVPRLAHYAPQLLSKEENVHVLSYLEVLILLHALIQTAADYNLNIRQRWPCTCTVKFIDRSFNKHSLSIY